MKKPNEKLPPVLTMAEIEKMKQAERVALFAAKDQASSRIFIELGKLCLSIKTGLGKGQTLFGLLGKVGVRKGSISNASQTSRVYEQLVPTGHLGEADFDRLTWADVCAINRVMSGASRAKLSAEAVALLIAEKPESFDDELVSLFETGQTVDEVAAQEKAKAEKAIADKLAADTAAAEKAQKEKDDAIAAALAAQQPTAPAATVPPSQPAAETPAEGVAAPAEAPAPIVTAETALETPVSVEAAPAHAAEIPEPVSNVVSMPDPTDPDAALPEWKAVVDQLVEDFATFSEDAQLEAHAHFVAALQNMIATAAEPELAAA